MNNLVNDINKGPSNNYLLNQLNKKMDKLTNCKENEFENDEKREIIDEEEIAKNGMKKDNLSFNRKINSINLFSVCQYCKKAFNSSINLPLLFECGHFYCKSCVLIISKENKNKVICPEDGFTQNSIENLKVMKNLIHENNYTNKYISSSGSSNCKTHENEKLNYYCYNTEELLCVYCAFNLYRNNNNYQIVEMNENCADILNSVNEMLEQNETFIRSLRHSLSEMKKNKNE